MGQFFDCTKNARIKILNLEMSKGPIYNYCHITTKATIMKFITSVILEISILCVFIV